MDAGKPGQHAPRENGGRRARTPLPVMGRTECSVGAKKASAAGALARAEPSVSKACTAAPWRLSAAPRGRRSHAALLLDRFPQLLRRLARVPERHTRLHNVPEEYLARADDARDQLVAQAHRLGRHHRKWRERPPLSALGSRALPQLARVQRSYFWVQQSRGSPAARVSHVSQALFFFGGFWGIKSNLELSASDGPSHADFASVELFALCLLLL